MRFAIVLEGSGLSSEWKEVLLEEVSREVTVGFVGSMASEYVQSGIPFLRSLNIEPYQVNMNDIKFITPEFHEKQSKSKLQPGDVVIVRTGKPGTCSVVPGWLKDANCSDLVIVRPGPKIDPYFLAYYVNSVAAHHIYSHLVGAVQQHFNVGSAKKIKINLPTLEEQTSITAVLNAVSSKIELNNSINKNLEEMAQALFKRWFVDFEFPNENGEPYKSSGGEFEESEMGLIPKGWKVIGLNEIIQINPKRALKKGTAYPYVEMKNLINNYARVTELAIRELSSGSKFKNGDVLLARITPCLENGKTAYVDFLENDQMGWGSTEFIVLRTSGNIPSEYAYFLARSDIFRTHAISNMTGSSGRQRVPDSSLRNFKFVFPRDLESIINFGGVAKSVLDLMKRNDDESNRLKAIRDSLLPKLMSGEIRVPVKMFSRVQTTDLPKAAESKEQYSTT